MEALSPRDANAQRAAAKPDPGLKTAAQLRAVKEKDHPPVPPAEVNEPASIDRPDGAIYVVGKMLGKGGFAVCYHGQLQSTRQRYALKIVKSQMPPKMEQKFQTELQIHSKMRQQNIVQFFRAFSFNACTFLVLELCPNGSLMDMVKRRRGLTEAEVRFYTVQIAGAMKYMHSKGIIHRDLKMGNIFLDADMNAKIGDFGLAALMVTGRDMQTIRRTTLCGTPNYIAPEILEKGKKGHDHMVDVWSLGVIVFAMLTSKPPFQSTTTDEIYRKARERDYEWPKVDAIISSEAKDLVALMLQDADERPYPDEIVQHPFFVSGYVPSQADMTTRLRELPPDKAEFYTGRMSSVRAARVVESLRSFCRECGVGPWSDRQMVLTHVWKEVAAEEKAGLTPAIPLAENIVYRPFEEWVREQRELVERSGYRSLAQNSMGYNNTYSNTLPRLHPSSAPPADDLFAIASQRTQPPLGLLRAPPQSFAAQQRALNRPTNLAPAAKRQGQGQGPEVAISAGTFTGTPAAIIDATLPSRPKQSETAGSEATLSLRPKHRDAASALAPAAAAPAPASRPATTIPSPPSSQEPNELNAPKARRPPPPPTMRDAAPILKPTAAATATAATTAAAVAATAAATAAVAVAAGNVDEAAQRPRPRPRPDRIESKSSSGSTDSLGSSSSAEARSAEARSAEPTASLIGPHEMMQIMAGTSPDTILQRLQRLEIELERALNSRSMAFVSSRTVTPRQPPMVIKWVDYTNKYGLGYMLSNGTVGCLVKALPTPDGPDRMAICPATCVLVRGAVDHLQRRKDPSYPDRRQPTPMDRDVGFFEFGSEEGVAAVRVPPQMFQVMVHDDDTAGKMRQGKDVYEHRKRERVIVWKRLGYYMAARGRDESILVDPAGGAGGEDWEFQHQHQQPNPELVVLYQGFGDARCWVFADGHLQFNFPDHTKIVIDPTGTWCHFWHLPKEAAARLAESGTLGDTALDKRSALTYPLQTLLNFQVKSATISASARTTTRRRPEIDPELQGVPAANDFRRKVAFIRDVVSEWVANGGLGNSSMDRTRRLRWSGYRELNPPNTYEKHVWVTLGARWGDRRVATHLDPRAPHELGEDLDDEKRKKKV